MKLEKVDSSRGAPMGRADNITEPDAAITFHLDRMEMVDGDYDNGGAYWGAGNARTGYMYHAYGDGEEEKQEMFIRAGSRGDAEAQVKAKFENASFFPEENPPELLWATFSYGLVEIGMTLEQAESASESGDRAQDVEALLQLPEIKEQFAKISDENLVKELEGYGAWSEEELADREANERRILWLAANEIAEEASDKKEEK